MRSRPYGLPHQQQTTVIGFSQSRQMTRLGLQPVANNAGVLFSILWPSLGEGVIHHIIALDAERLLDDLGRAVAIVTVDALVMIYRSMFLYTHNA
jgi:hypothetical protein